MEWYILTRTIRFSVRWRCSALLSKHKHSENSDGKWFWFRLLATSFFFFCLIFLSLTKSKDNNFSKISYSPQLFLPLSGCCVLCIVMFRILNTYCMYGMFGVNVQSSKSESTFFRFLFLSFACMFHAIGVITVYAVLLLYWLSCYVIKTEKTRNICTLFTCTHSKHHITATHPQSTYPTNV